MRYEDEKFIIYYNECDKRYIELLVKIINERSPFICEFFDINYNKKIVIKLYDNLEKYKANIEDSFRRQNLDRKYEDWMIANTEDGNINMQSLDLVKEQDDFKYYTEEIFCYNACHEFTHLCQQYLNSKNPGWFWELIATNIGNPENQHECNDYFTLKELNEKFDDIDGYGIVYKFGKYIFENYDRKTILSWIKDDEKFMNEIGDIIDSYNNLMSVDMENSRYEKLDEYLNQDIDNPKYLFHGSSKKLFKLVPKLSHDSDGNIKNIDEAIFLFPSFLKSTPYAFKDTIKKNSAEFDWDFEIPNGDEFPLMKMKNVNIDDSIIGYIYVFLNNNDMNKDDNSYQYKCYKELEPIDVVEVCYKDYMKYYEVMDKRK